MFDAFAKEQRVIIHQHLNFFLRQFTLLELVGHFLQLTWIQNVECLHQANIEGFLDFMSYRSLRMIHCM